ncbi:hypothetical protein [Clostridium tyrobutyricum]|uniref:hypothetical protein n=1 Tax=Clostridium tyrobutyricum TaxID=1519 RepID=UPI001C385CE7|nr:hypothetical protein [Clostridium tyrobutyricum]MBV4429072.1 hypothetical protein [Clostridium tyrobutyricum]MBV4444149.1 hypothetical protein [Clostridium tyrobutyricum]
MNSINILEESHNRLQEMLFADKKIEVSTTPDIDSIHDCDRYLSTLEDYDVEFEVKYHTTAVTAVIKLIHTVETGIMIELLRNVKTEMDLLSILAKADKRGQRELYEDVAENLCLM